MAAVAAEAGVALKTVYLAFETKSGVLRALWNLLIRGDEEQVPIKERSWFREVLDEADPQRQLRLLARNSRIVKLRVGAVMGMVRKAADADPEIAALWDRIQADFHVNQGLIVKSIHQKKALKPDLNVARATDMLWTIHHPDLWHLLVGERGWSPEQYEQWCADLACSQLLAPPTRQVRSRR